MYPRLFKIDPLATYSIFLFGPRATGKTAWLKKNFPEAIYFDLLEGEIYAEFLASPGRLAEQIPENYQGWVIIDEIQKVPTLLDEVHRLIEGKGYRFILTGSSARKLKRSGVNLLAARAITYHLHPLSVLELGEDFDLNKALQRGHLPAVVTHDVPDKYLGTYIQTYLKEEVMQEGLVRNLSAFARFLEVASFSQGETINYSEIAREVHISRHTIENFFSILEDLLIGYRLPVFTKRAKREVVVRPKFYYFDVGVYRAIRPSGPLDTSEEIDGSALETLFLQEIKAINDYFDLGYDLYYWRTQSQVEVDFIAYGKMGLYAFEIKRKVNISQKDLKGLKLFGEDYPIAKRFLLYGGKRAYFDHGIQVVPFAKAIVNLKEMLSVE